MVSIIYFLLAVLALFFWIFETGVCTSGGCSAVPGLLGRSWYLWGAVFYAVSAMLCSWSRKNITVGVFISTGALFHVLLIAYGYQISGEICSVCWKFSAVDALLALMYWFMPEKEPVQASPLFIGPVKAMAIMSLSILIVNPATGSVTVPNVTAEMSLTKPAPITEAKNTNNDLSSAGEVNSQLRVLTLEGESKYLDITAKPALIFASWCPHCDDALKEAAKLPQEKRPYLVVTYLREGDIKKAREKLNGSGLKNETYYLAPDPPSGLEAVPSFLHWNHGLEIAIFGEE